MTTSAYDDEELADRKQNLGAAIVRLRTAKGLKTQKAFAVKLKRKPGTVNQWESGKVFPDLASLFSIAESLSVDVSEILSLAGLTSAPAAAAAVVPPACPLRSCPLSLHSRDQEESSSMNGPSEAWRMIGKSWALHDEDPKQWARLLRVLHAETDDLPDPSTDTTAREGQTVVRDLSARETPRTRRRKS